MNFTYVIVDDERLLRESLAAMLQRFCPDFIPVGTAHDTPSARRLLAGTKPDIIFCDIQMQGENGFELLQSIDTSYAHIVFVTAFGEYALRAIKSRAFDYLLKPIDTEELKSTAGNLRRSIAESKMKGSRQQEYHESVAALVRELKDMQPDAARIAIHHASGISFVSLGEILFLEGNGSYTNVHLAGGNKIVASRILSEFEELLSYAGFVRIHKSTIVNLHYVREYSRVAGFMITLANGVQLAVGRRRVQEVMEKFQHYAKNI